MHFTIGTRYVTTPTPPDSSVRTHNHSFLFYALRRKLDVHRNILSFIPPIPGDLVPASRGVHACGVRGGVYSFFACLSRLNYDHASLLRRRAGRGRRLVGSSRTIVVVSAEWVDRQKRTMLRSCLSEVAGEPRRAERPKRPDDTDHSTPSIRSTGILRISPTTGRTPQHEAVRIRSTHDRSITHSFLTMGFDDILDLTAHTARKKSYLLKYPIERPSCVFFFTPLQLRPWLEDTCLQSPWRSRAQSNSGKMDIVDPCRELKHIDTCRHRWCTSVAHPSARKTSLKLTK